MYTCWILCMCNVLCALHASQLATDRLIFHLALGQNMSGGSSQNWLYVVLDKIGISKSGKEEANQETKCCAMCMQLPGGHLGGHPSHPGHPANQATEFPLQNPGKAVGGIFTDMWEADFYRCYSICRTHISQISKHIKEMSKLWFCHSGWVSDKIFWKQHLSLYTDESGLHASRGVWKL